ncbi:UDP-glycosyltransferase [Flavobacterium cerinum]|uniref:UDP-glycosyltransferase n=1 Tax=Flavobacterium cerinum TaxID=2502784 RepID=A0ABY5J0E1_9FLAO|nr:UDP-glycosyltransferase [Flavobacterium cerinum]UUC47044.1 UDP-glycosyltransferase [Flavobacterium cerinum]
MSKSKIFILLPDGVGLRNFAYSKFHELGIEQGHEVIFWNNTPFQLSDLGFEEIVIRNGKSNKRTEVYKNARKQIELNRNKKQFNDAVYDYYRFPYSYRNIKTALKNIATQWLTLRYTSDDGLQTIRQRVKELEKQTSYFRECLEVLKKEKPAMVFCTNQRPMTAIAPLLAAQELGIPTATFIFSWDNLPKATMVAETDYYFVWSDFMKAELLKYYPYIGEESIFVTGTPQFESHYEKERLILRSDFFQANGLDPDKKYICYSGDDITTCPDDPKYLEDVAEAVENLNAEGYKLGILFRRCPVDFSDRFDRVLEKYKAIIVPVKPKWEKKGGMWNTILPTPEDMNLQVNTIAHTEMVINLGSSMVFDYAAHHKPCAYINYDVKNKVAPDWSVQKIYKYIHFRSMPDPTTVLWLNEKNDIKETIKKVVTGQHSNTEMAETWFRIINAFPPKAASKKIWDAINTIVS